MKKIIRKNKTDTIEKNREKIKNRKMLRLSQKIAINVLTVLETICWDKKYLAKVMNVDKKTMNLILKGNSYITIKNVYKLQKALGTKLICKDDENYIFGNHLKK